MPKDEHRSIEDGIPIIRMKKLPEPKPSLLFDWDLKDSTYRPVRVKQARLCEFCAQPNPCRWCNMADEFNV
jgi:hypothetical protein